MAKNFTVLCGIAAALLSVNAAHAQERRAALPTEGPGAYFWPDVRFGEGPKPGESVPDVIVVDRNGAPINIRDTVGEHYTVFVLGCLT